MVIKFASEVFDWAIMAIYEKMLKFGHTVKIKIKLSLGFFGIQKDSDAKLMTINLHNLGIVKQNVKMIHLKLEQY